MERVKDKVFTRPIVYGNTAHYLGKKREEDGHTHEWTVFVKPYYNEDPSKYIRKVQFKLHDSYANATRSNLLLSLCKRLNFIYSSFGSMVASLVLLL